LPNGILKDRGEDGWYFGTCVVGQELKRLPGGVMRFG
jgi:hypothetical protein